MLHFPFRSTAEKDDEQTKAAHSHQSWVSVQDNICPESTGLRENDLPAGSSKQQQCIPLHDCNGRQPTGTGRKPSSAVEPATAVGPRRGSATVALAVFPSSTRHTSVGSGPPDRRQTFSQMKKLTVLIPGGKGRSPPKLAPKMGTNNVPDVNTALLRPKERNVFNRAFWSCMVAE